MLATTWGVSYDAWALIFSLGVAAGTILLAVATLSVARATKGLAVSTRQEVIAQSRPVLVAQSCELNVGFVRVNVRNVGAGPALNTRLEPPDRGASAIPGAVVSVDDRFVTLWLATARQWAIDLTKARVFQLLVSYDDLAGEKHYTI